MFCSILILLIYREFKICNIFLIHYFFNYP